MLPNERRTLLGAALLAGAGLLLGACASSESSPPSSTTSAPDPGYGLPLDAPPDSSAATALATPDPGLDPDERELLARIAEQPTGVWISDPPRLVEAHVQETTTAAAARGAIPLLVAYSIPGRDCGGQSSSDAALDADGYRDWVSRFAAGIGGRRAIVVVEPDALAQLDCLDDDAQTERLSLLEDAVDALADAGADVYLDAGHSDWYPAGTIADRLKRAGIDRARGFSLNVANFRSTDDELAYARAIAEHLPGTTHVVIDTSRNGKPSDSDEWCNPSDRALGRPPTTETGDDFVDAYLWIKPPGNSDGTCNGGPPAGQWWEAYALMLAENAAEDAATSGSAR